MNSNNEASGFCLIQKMEMQHLSEHSPPVVFLQSAARKAALPGSCFTLGIGYYTGIIFFDSLPPGATILTKQLRFIPKLSPAPCEKNELRTGASSTHSLQSSPEPGACLPGSAPLFPSPPAPQTALGAGGKQGARGAPGDTFCIALWGACERKTQRRRHRRSWVKPGGAEGIGWMEKP